jgi:hypothetical protein
MITKVNLRLLTCWRGVLGASYYVNALSSILQSVAESKGISIRQSEVGDDGEAVSFSVECTLPGKTFDETIQLADALVDEIVNRIERLHKNTVIYAAGISQAKTGVP